jgi:hypothetical protein
VGTAPMAVKAAGAVWVVAAAGVEEADRGAQVVTEAMEAMGIMEAAVTMAVIQGGLLAGTVARAEERWGAQ